MLYLSGRGICIVIRAVWQRARPEGGLLFFLFLVLLVAITPQPMASGIVPTLSKVFS